MQPFRVTTHSANWQVRRYNCMVLGRAKGLLLCNTADCGVHSTTFSSQQPIASRSATRLALPGPMPPHYNQKARHLVSWAPRFASWSWLRTRCSARCSTKPSWQWTSPISVPTGRRDSQTVLVGLCSLLAPKLLSVDSPNLREYNTRPPSPLTIRTLASCGNRRYSPPCWCSPPSETRP
jgi:hypothetical protein